MSFGHNEDKMSASIIKSAWASATGLSDFSGKVFSRYKSTGLNDLITKSDVSLMSAVMS